jgi:hypothetical protein
MDLCFRQNRVANCRRPCTHQYCSYTSPVASWAGIGCCRLIISQRFPSAYLSRQSLRCIHVDDGTRRYMARHSKARIGKYRRRHSYVLHDLNGMAHCPTPVARQRANLIAGASSLYEEFTCSVEERYSSGIIARSRRSEF